MTVVWIKNPKKFQIISQKISKILKISNSLHRTWRPKTFSGLFLLVNEDKSKPVESVHDLIQNHQEARQSVDT